ncbi:MAG TPA: chemotaxis protein CheB, partial [Candidatus Saccharimonadales bacterium]|nr:chemotaxis protein CheB [Candidatus Saccharimonadales bacterium]
TVLVAPGRGSLRLYRDGAQLKAEIRDPTPDDRFVPSVDKMFESAAQAMGADVLGVVLTGMGGDGGRGTRAVKGAGGRTLAEAPETASWQPIPTRVPATQPKIQALPGPVLILARSKFRHIGARWSSAARMNERQDTTLAG